MSPGRTRLLRLARCAELFGAAAECEHREVNVAASPGSPAAPRASRGPSPRFLLALGALFGAAFFGFIAFGIGLAMYKPFEEAPFYLWGIAGGTVAAVVAGTAFGLVMGRTRHGVLAGVILLLPCVALALGAFVHANAIADGSPSRVRSARVVKRTSTSRKPRVEFATVDSWHGSGTIRLELPRELAGVGVGDSLLVTTRDGALGVEWIEAIRRETPAR
jgi:hypothetical protein